MPDENNQNPGADDQETKTPGADENPNPGGEDAGGGEDEKEAA